MCALVWLAVLAVGARRVMRDRTRWQRDRQRARQAWMDWHRCLAAEMSPEQSRQWQEAAEQTPEILIRACAVETEADR
jgi:hypothetical protein